MKSILISTGILGCALAQGSSDLGLGYDYKPVVSADVNTLQNALTKPSLVFKVKAFAKVVPPLCSGQMAGGKVVNAGFESTTCGSDWCTYNEGNYLNQVNGWIPAPTM